MPKIIDSMRTADAAGDVYVAFEYFPPRTKDGVVALHKRIARMAEQSKQRRQWSSYVHIISQVGAM